MARNEKCENTENFFLQKVVLEMNERSEVENLVLNLGGDRLFLEKGNEGILFFFFPYDGTKEVGPTCGKIDNYYFTSNKSYFQTKKLKEDLKALGVSLSERPMFYKEELASSLKRGRNTLLYHDDFGSRFVVSHVIFPLDVASQEVLRFLRSFKKEENGGLLDSCEKCQKCQKACPGNAIQENGFDKSKCLRQFMVQGQLPIGSEKMFKNFVLGCDICQNVCEKNSNEKTGVEISLQRLYEAFFSKEELEFFRKCLGNNVFRKNKILPFIYNAMAESGDKGFLKFLSQENGDENLDEVRERSKKRLEVRKVDLKRCGLEDFKRLKYDCECGKSHSVKTQDVHIGFNNLSILDKSLKKIMPCGKVLFLSTKSLRNWTFEVKSEMSNFETLELILDDFVPSVDLCNSISVPEDARALVVFGDIKIIDVAKMVAKTHNLPLIVVLSSLTDPRFMSSVSTFCEKGMTLAFESKAPDEIICDKEILENAPRDIVRASYGLIVSSYLYVFDAIISSRFSDKKICTVLSELLLKGADKAYDGGVLYEKNQEMAIDVMVDGMFFMGFAFQLLDLSSKSRFGLDQVASALEVNLKKQGKDFAFGDLVFYSFVKITEIYNELFLKELKIDTLPHDVDKRLEILVKDFGYSYEEGDVLTSVLFTAQDLQDQVDTFSCVREEGLKVVEKIQRKLDTLKVCFFDIFSCDINLFNEIAPTTLKSAIGISTEFTNQCTPLVLMRNFGLLEEFLSL